MAERAIIAAFRAFAANAFTSPRHNRSLAREVAPAASGAPEDAERRRDDRSSRRRSVDAPVRPAGPQSHGAGRCVRPLRASARRRATSVHGERAPRERRRPSREDPCLGRPPLARRGRAVAELDSSPQVVGQAVGHVQAGVREGRADLAWVVGTPFQSRGYATEAGRRATAWIREHCGVSELRAAIHPYNVASGRVAAHIGLRPSGEITDEGEQLWTTRHG